MDVKGITWVGNIYQKFESLCLEVEEIMYQDTVDFMENQVQTVGASVKKFYSGVVTDLLPPSPNDSGKKETDLQESKDSEIITKPRFHIKKETLKREIDQVRKRSKILAHVERKKVNIDNLFTTPTTLSGFQNRTQFNDGKLLKENKYCDSESRVLQNRQISEAAQEMNRFRRSEESLIETGKEKQESTVPEIQASVENTEVHHRVEKVVEEYENRTDPSCDLAAATQDNCSGNGIVLVSVVEPSTLEDLQRSDTSGKNDFESGQVDSCDMISTEEPSFTVSNSERLEESCILVDGDELSFIALSKDKQKPYKKKLRDAFSPRKMASRAREYKQLAVKYSDNNAQSAQERVKPEGSSQFQQVSESEWELL